MRTITADMFKAATGRLPIQDDLDRCNCTIVEFGHDQCGWCDIHNKPRFICLCPKTPKIKYYDLNGKTVPDHSAMSTDHVEQIFVVRIKSSTGITAETVKNIIQNKHEVLGISETSKIIRGNVVG